MLEPAISYWVDLLEGNRNREDKNFLSMCSNLSEDMRDALDQIDNWVYQVARISSPYEDIQLLLIETIRQFKFYPNLRNGEAVEMVFSNLFKAKIRQRISWFARRRELVIESTPEKGVIPFYPDHPDYLLMKSLPFNRWESFIFAWILRGGSKQDTYKNIHITHSKFNNEEQAIWDTLKKTY